MAFYARQSLQQLCSLRDIDYTYILSGCAWFAGPYSRQRTWEFDRPDIFNDYLNNAALHETGGASDQDVVWAYSTVPAIEAVDLRTEAGVDPADCMGTVRVTPR